MFFIIYYLLGICGLVRMIWETFFTEADFYLLLRMTAGISGGFVICHLFGRLVFHRWKKETLLVLCLTVVGILTAAGIFLLPGRDSLLRGLPSLSEGFDQLYQSVMVTSWNHFYPSDPVSRTDLIWDGTTYVAFGIGLVVFSVLLYLAAVKASKGGVLLVMIPPLAAVLAVGMTPSFGAMSLALLCCVGIFAGSHQDQGGGKEWCRKTEIHKANHIRIPPYVIRSLAATAVSFVLLLVSSGLASFWDGRVQERKLEARQLVRETFAFMDFPENPALSLPDFPGLTSNPGELSNQDEIRYTGETVAELETDRAPAGTLYLKNYSGSLYTGHGWDRRPEDMEPDGYSMAVWFEEVSDNELYQELSVNLSDVLDGPYVPYFSRVSETGGGNNYFCFWPENYLRLTGKPQFQEWALSFAEQADEFGTGGSVSAAAYLDWPDTLDRLKQICDENPRESVEEIRRFIVSWLAETCSYNLQVGRFPEDRDPIEYFLFERREGYCQHFASAAVMMFRMYGIPARYATGLAVSEDLFQNSGQETAYTAYPTDRCAHAWVEIYQEEYGWVPVEVTPAGAVDGVSPAQQQIALPDPMSDSSSLQEEQPEATPEPETSVSPEQPEGQTDNVEDSQPGAGTDSESDKTAGRDFRESDAFRTFLGAVRTAAVGIGLAVVLGLALWIRRAVVLAGRKRKNAAGIFEDLLNVLKKIGLPADSDWLEDDFAEKVCGKFTWLNEEEFQTALDLVSEATYGKKRASKREWTAVRNLYLKCCREAYRKMGRWEKFRFRVWDAYY